jgi:hypothetical protein
VSAVLNHDLIRCRSWWGEVVIFREAPQIRDGQIFDYTKTIFWPGELPSLPMYSGDHIIKEFTSVLSQVMARLPIARKGRERRQRS